MRFRTAERSCAFFRHHIRSASRILDCGLAADLVGDTGEVVWVDTGSNVAKEPFQHRRWVGLVRGDRTCVDS